MSVKFKLCLILTLGIFVTTVGAYLSQHQPDGNITQTTYRTEQPQVSAVLVYRQRANYQTIPLESINSLLRGSDPAALALNALEGIGVDQGERKIKVEYPEPNQALVTVTEIQQGRNNSISQINYRVEMSSFGRSLLVSSPPIWQIIWAGASKGKTP
ncbi:hypothetical protein VB711_06310 [Cronbergia sp. UHCC 0137]|uniref:hypothetical protein n=1 Tax=Cronbergia sp. UHCC 0137 TaxID=3110239 RepID=UPI002B1F3D79|nr:hypothetical protein [Cronbergia sp. UHCC 0137]MEA5617450.1 hypothetical protein [Cronbergia sp. UHCC 0137]